MGNIYFSNANHCPVHYSKPVDLKSRNYTEWLAKPSRRLKKPVKIILGASFAVLSLFLVIFLFQDVRGASGSNFKGSTSIDTYKDLNTLHLRHARANGISPLSSGKALHSKLDDLLDDDKLVKISDNKYYVVNSLSHSHPYLVPEAAELLDQIGKRFQKKLSDHGLDDYRFRVTSLLRTQESQRSLSRSNVNASPTSAHLYGTTFDITYKSLIKRRFFGGKRVVSERVPLSLLSDAIGELRKEGRLVVVTEKKEACFHITVR